MSDIFIIQPHQFQQQEIPPLLEKLALRLEQKIEAQCKVEDKQLRFSRSGAKGKVLVDEENLVIEVQLGLMLKAMKPMIEQQIRDELAKL
jgi:putative polyhydroxyalkanoate system protein